MKIQSGKYYKTRDGRKVGPIERGEQYSCGPWRYQFGNNHYLDDGRACRDGNGSFMVRDDDLVEILPDGPVRTVTRKEIAPGVYGCIDVQIDGCCDFAHATNDPSELRAAAKTLNEIADFLDEKVD